MDIQEFLKEHIVTDYNTNLDNKNISFIIDNVKYVISPFYRSMGINGDYPSGYEVFIEENGKQKSLFSFYCYINDEIKDVYSIMYNKLFKEVKNKNKDEKINDYYPYIIYHMVYMWNPKYHLNHINDEQLEKALYLVNNGYIKNIKLIKKKKENENDKEEMLIHIEYFHNACGYGTYKNNFPPNKEKDFHYLNSELSLPIKTCDEPSCGETRCITRLAGYIKYAIDNDIYDILLKEREEYRQTNNNTELFIEWNPKDVDKFKNVPPFLFDLAEELIEKNYISIRPYYNNESNINSDDRRFHVDLDYLGFCKDAHLRSENAKKNNTYYYSGYVDLKKELSFIKSPSEKLPYGWNVNSSSSCMSNLICDGCKSSLCPYTLAAYLYYLKHKGREQEIIDAKEHSISHPEERYYGEDTFDFPLFEEEHYNELKEYISNASKDLYDLATILLDRGDVTLHFRKVSPNNETFYRILSNKRLDNVYNIEDYDSNYYAKDTVFSTDVGYLSDKKDCDYKYRLARLIGAIDFLRRRQIDFSSAVNKRFSGIDIFKDYVREIEGFSRIYSFISSDKTSSFFSIIEGEENTGKKDTIKNIATILARTGKIETAEYTKMTFEQLSETLTTHKDYNGMFSFTSGGYLYDFLDKRKLYVLTGLDQFLLDWQMYKSPDSSWTIHLSMKHLVKVLGSFLPNTYVIIVSLSEKATKEFLDINKRFKFTYGQNILKFPNRPTNILYDKYIEELSDDVLKKIKNKEEHERQFSEFISLNERFLPFKNDALSHYLAEYSNVENAPVLPPDVYDGKNTREALDNMVGMKAVKEQLKEFESYCLFRKKARANGIEIEQGNLHMQFLGNPGTGKTTIARIVAKMLYDIGILEEDKVIEVERKDLVAKYLGQSAIKTTEKINEAMGGVLFIDEAYSLYLDDRDSFGLEVIATLIKAMEDHKSEFIVIFAGYTKEMGDFLKANSGIESRIGYTFHFKDYTSQELTEIFKKSFDKQKFTLEDGVLDKVDEICSYYRRRKNFGNGRFVKKIEQETIINHAKNSNNNGWDITKITVCDIPDIKDFASKNSGEKENYLELEKVIGMNDIKEQIRKFKTRINYEQRARTMGAKIKRGNSHMLFLGGPGTGKTTIARIITKELYEAGIILENKLVEVERKDLVAGYVGQTATKTTDVIESAMGGVLFIDEAYSLTIQKEAHWDFGQEAIATIIKAMEDHKDDFVVIFAGYEREMKQFIDSNSGIASRIGYTFTFKDYTAEELTDIYNLKMESNGLKVIDTAKNKLKDLFQYFVSVPNFGNGRFAERIVNISIELHAERLEGKENINDEDILTIIDEDIPSIKYVIEHMPDGDDMINPEDIKEEGFNRTAIHEIGHALVQKLLFPDLEIKKITISAEGNGTLGYVYHDIHRASTPTRTELENRIKVSMAGLASEKVFLNEYGCGGTSDIEHATNIAKNMITRYGMSKNGFAAFNEKELSKETKDEINEIISKQFNEDIEIITKYKNDIEKVKTHLLKNKTITEEEFCNIIKIKE